MACIRRVVVLVLIMSVKLCCEVRSDSPTPTVSLDLSKFGYLSRGAADYSGVTFLSEDLLLVSVVQRIFHGGSEQKFVDKPDSRLVLFNVSTQRIVGEITRPVEKWQGSVQAAARERFVVWDNAGIRVCGTDFRCGQSVATSRLLGVSPGGTVAVVEGERRKADSFGTARVIELDSLREIASIEHRLQDGTFQEVIPGDGSLLIGYLGASVASAGGRETQDRLTVRRAGREGPTIRFDGRGALDESRFLATDAFAYFDWGKSQGIVAHINGSELYRTDVAKVWRSRFLSTLSGKRFGCYEYGYTTLNSILNFLDIDNARNSDFQRVRVFDVKSGEQMGQFEWDPRPSFVEPALSPLGTKLARVKGNILEIVPVK